MKEKSIAIVRKKNISILKSVGLKSAKIDAQVLIESITGKSREFLLAHPEFELSKKQITQFNRLVTRRKKHEPIAYLINKKEFFGLSFFVDKNVLIPRPETEILVEEALKFLEYGIKNREFRILDIGTGSGNIIISITKKCGEFAIAKKLHFFASDISKKALGVARKNARKHKVNIKFIQSDLFENMNDKFDLIIANLPYVPLSDNKRVTNNEIEFEPRGAIFADDNGMALIKKFFDQAKSRINKKGLILVEVDPRNALELQNYASKLYKSVGIKKDFSGIYRVLKIS